MQNSSFLLTSAPRRSSKVAARVELEPAATSSGVWPYLQPERDLSTAGMYTHRQHLKRPRTVRVIRAVNNGHAPQPKLPDHLSYRLGLLTVRRYDPVPVAIIILKYKIDHFEIQNRSFLIQNPSFLMKNPSFLIQNSSFKIQNSPREARVLRSVGQRGGCCRLRDELQNSSCLIHISSFLIQNSSFLLTRCSESSTAGASGGTSELYPAPMLATAPADARSVAIYDASSGLSSPATSRISEISISARFLDIFHSNHHCKYKHHHLLYKNSSISIEIATDSTRAVYSGPSSFLTQNSSFLIQNSSF